MTQARMTQTRQCVFKLSSATTEARTKITQLTHNTIAHTTIWPNGEEDKHWVGFAKTLTWPQ